MNVYWVNDVRHTEIQTAEALVTKPSDYEVKMATKKLKRHKSPGTHHIPAELIKAQGRAPF